MLLSERTGSHEKIFSWIFYELEKFYISDNRGNADSHRYLISFRSAEQHDRAVCYDLLSAFY